VHVRQLDAFLQATPKAKRVVALHDTDADGIAAGAVWQRAMERIEYSNLARVVPDRERSAWTPENMRRVAEQKPESLFVMDLGSQPQAVVPDVRTCFIDHHRPGGALASDTLISAYTWQPVPNTSLIVYDLFSPLAHLEDLDWVAAIGTMSDLGERAPFDLLQNARKKYTAKYLKEATALVNAIRRASCSDPEAGARALLSHTSPKELVLSESEDVIAMRAAREEVKAP
jgi:single-stranded-DNA-specific exonuclease